ncbi:MAG TPA: bifunctional phosphopantothenoylcysteine decarboxylase/phosphopantothenate--cysteine ligase CoaBC, partial [Sutterella sp.]|nr:bifunctional phosphopantothenoylcysteine decarboxylase/phosphopantothenate--cysteine ligase CoaBC [Sutterella sp.]
VAPASADILAKAANGIADDFLSTALLAAACPVFFAPAMNARMWENPATKRNVRTLLSDGKHILGPVTGTLACETSGAGRMLEPETIYEALCAATHPKILEKCRVLITAGATAEPIDPVRVITNRSSGKQGFAVARAFAMAGAEVTLIAGKTNEATPLGVKRIDVTSAQEMFEAVKREVSDNEVFISVAAVSDWRVKNASSHKIKKAFSGIPHIELEENPDILAYVAKLPDAPFCVGFAAETENLIENARAKLFTKGVSLIVANLVADALETQTTSVVFVTADEAKPLANTTKEAVAEALAQAVSRFVN